MQQKTIEKYEGILDDIINSGLSIPNYFKKHNKSVNTFYAQMNNIAKGAIADIEIRERFLHKYEIAKRNTNKNENTSTEIIENVETDDRAETAFIRDDDNKIQFYKYEIFRKNKTPLSGKLTREEMNTIHRLYSYYGDALTQRVISRHFVDFSLIDFKRILRAFNITKASAPFAPHMIEECTEEELRDIQLREKENSFLRKAEEDQIKNNEKLLKKYAQENIELKKQLKDASNFTVTIPETLEPVILPEYSYVGQSINLYLSDIHLGAAVTSGAMYQENVEYGFKEAKRRLEQVLIKLNDFDSFDTINVVLLGDNVDSCGFTGKTCSLTHTLPENMDAREQGNKYIELILWFIDSLANSENELASKINLYSVPCGNHSGNFEYMCNKAIMALVNAKYPDIKTTLWDEFYGIFTQGSHTFVACHGN